MNRIRTQRVCMYQQLQRQMHEINHILPHKHFFALHICIFFVSMTKLHRNKIIWLCPRKNRFHSVFLFVLITSTNIDEDSCVLCVDLTAVVIVIVVAVSLCACAHVFGRFY